MILLRLAFRLIVTRAEISISQVVLLLLVFWSVPGCKDDSQLKKPLRTVRRGSIADLEQRIKQDTHTIQRCPNDYAAYLDRGSAYRLSGRMREAIADFDEVIRLNPNCDVAYCVRGLAHDALGDPRQAIIDLSEAIRLCSSKPDSYGYKGFNYSERTPDMDPAEVRPFYTTLAKRLHMRGLVYEKSGDNARALDDYTEAIKTYSGCVEAYYSRALLNHRNGHFEDAIRDYDRLLLFPLDSPVFLLPLHSPDVLRNRERAQKGEPPEEEEKAEKNRP